MVCQRAAVEIVSRVNQNEQRRQKQNAMQRHPERGRLGNGVMKRG